jgi:hypothetical protein
MHGAIPDAEQDADANAMRMLAVPGDVKLKPRDESVPFPSSLALISLGVILDADLAHRR